MRKEDEYTGGINMNRLRVIRQENELSQTQVAEIIGFDVIDRLCHYERGRAQPSLINVIRLCALYRVTIEDMYPKLWAQVHEEVRTGLKRHFAKT